MKRPRLVESEMPWVWSVLGIVALWLVLAITTRQFTLGALGGTLPAASFLALAAIGQSFAIVTGGGNADLSIPSVIAFSAYVSINLINGSNAMTVPGLLLTIALGAVIGAVNAALIVRLRVPAIIATLATGYVISTFALLANERSVAFSVSPILRTLAAGRLAGIPVIALLVAVIGGATAFAFHRTGFGRMLMAVGQSPRAADLARVPVGLITALAFIISGGLAALTGVLLAANAGGAFLNLGRTYLLQSVGAVVIGGSPAFGGRTTVVGTLSGSVLLVLLAAATQIVGLPSGMQEIVQGAVIIAVLAIAGSRAALARRKPAAA